MQYPKMLYKGGIPEGDSVLVHNEAEHQAKSADGYARLGEKVPETNADTGKSERDEVIAKLEAAGVKFDKRMGTDKLKALVAADEELSP